MNIKEMVAAGNFIYNRLPIFIVINIFVQDAILN